jgi:hypothetical protein
MIEVSVKYSPKLSKGEQQLLLLPNRLANLRSVMIGAVAPAANRMLKRHWDSKGAAFGHEWAEWAESTLRKRIKKGNVAKGILRDTDHLFKVLFRARSGDDRLKVIRGGLRLSLNIRERKALYHQVGTQFMPERQVIPDPLPVSFGREVRAIVRDFVLSGRVTRA